MNRLRRILWTLLVPLLVVPVAATCEEEEDEREELTTKEVLAFLDKHLPDGAKWLNWVKEEEGLEEYQGALERAGETAREYFDIAEDDSEAAKTFLDMQRAELKVDLLVVQWHEAESDTDEAAIRKDLRKAVEGLFDVRMRFQKWELAALKAEVRAIASEIAEQEGNRSEAIDDEVAELLGEDEEDEDEGEEDESEEARVAAPE